MPRQELRNPHLNLWKTILAALGLGTIFTFLSWGFRTILDYYAGFHHYSLTIGDVLLGSGWLPISFWILWAWQPRRKHARWHRWLSGLSVPFYMSIFPFLGAIASWNAILNHPWNWIVNSILAGLLILAWILPTLSYRWSKRVASAQDMLSLRMLTFGGVGGLMVLAGILGAGLGMSTSRKGGAGTVVLIMAFAWALVAIFLAQYNAEHLWPYRPWQKEDE